MFTLILLAHVGGNSLYSMGGFQTEAACLAAGKVWQSLASGSPTDVEYKCIRMAGEEAVKPK